MSQNPILVASPTTRSGTTLLQRLITSSQNSVCYGENTGRRIQGLCEFSHKELLSIQSNKAHQELEWREVKGGNVDFWMAGLDLPEDFASNAFVGALQFYVHQIEEATRSLGKDIWAIRVSQLSFTQIVQMSDLINDLKCVFIYRNVFDVIKSQKAAGWISDDAKLVEACNDWVANTEVIATLKRNNFENLPAMLQVIEYEDLIKNLDDVIWKLEVFSGIKNIRREVAETRINTVETSANNEQERSALYVEPLNLTGAECEVIASICGERVTELYPDLSWRNFVSSN